jgi:uncharacterized protein (UPF0335 family)
VKDNFLELSKLNRKALRINHNPDRVIDNLEKELVCSTYIVAAYKALINRIKRRDDIDYDDIKPNEQDIEYELKQMGFRQDAINRIASASFHYSQII